MSVWGDELRHWREVAGLSRAELARLAHVSVKNVYNLEVRDQRPNTGTIQALVAVLDDRLLQCPDSWSASARQRFCQGWAGEVPPVAERGEVSDQSQAVLLQPANPSDGPLALDGRVSSPAPHQKLSPETTETAAPTRVNGPGPGRHTSRRRLVWVVGGLLAVVVVGCLPLLHNAPTSEPDPTLASGSTATPLAGSEASDQLSASVITDAIGPPRWWLSNDLAATKHQGTSLAFGRVEDVVAVGDWDGDGHDEPSVYRPDERNFFWSGDEADGVHLDYAVTGDWPLVGNWDGVNGDEPGVYRPSAGRFLLGMDAAHLLTIDLSSTGGGIPIVGDWDGDHDDDVGLYQPGARTFERVSLEGVGLPLVVFGEVGDLPLTGDWDGVDGDEIGVYRMSTRTFRFADSNGVEVGHVKFGASREALIPVVGDWDGDGRDTQGVIQH